MPRELGPLWCVAGLGGRRDAAARSAPVQAAYLSRLMGIIKTSLSSVKLINVKLAYS